LITNNSCPFSTSGVKRFWKNHQLMPRFELQTLTSYDDQSLINELKRVAALIPDKKLTRVEFDRLSRVSSSALFRRFGSWSKALIAGKLEDRYDDSNQPWSRDEIIEQLKSIAPRTGRPNLTTVDVERFGVSIRPIRRLFGSFKAALEASGLSQSRSGVRYTDEDCFENLLTTWTTLGRQPSSSEMDRLPSRVGIGAYKKRWGTWRKALQAFIDRVNQDAPEEAQPVVARETPSDRDTKIKRTSRDIPLGLRYTVLVRDRFRCVICGRSPATDLNVNLHIDHIKAWANGGETVSENLRSLCSDCNLGKGCREEG
jgi:5-methylcytosine-specific restriction endonuclease McrA